MHLTESAVKHIKKQLITRGRGIGMRVGLLSSGCSGYEYSFEFLDSIQAGETIEMHQDLTLAIPNNFFTQLNDLTIDFVTEGLQSGLVIQNPNEKIKCGCGKSVGF
ncbi:MAG: iron-sulfur cluster assembly accessory protein [Methylacidiphilales bacterium]|nr:iron-sulfur cluster assembly accessory protein [Candidatus Methylacidiphilales bacterium]